MTQASDPLWDLLHAPDRDASPGASPIIALATDEDPQLVAAVEALALRIVALERRGVRHGDWAELPADSAPPATGALRDTWRARFADARPIVLPGLVDSTPWQATLNERAALHAELSSPGGLQRFVARAEGELGPEFHVRHVGAVSHEPHASDAPTPDGRDLERARLSYARAGSTQRFDDLWLKSARLSLHPDDASLRLRLAFGREVVDDASRDIARHRAVSALAERLLPECALAHGHAPLGQLLAEWTGGECFLTQHIAYWNAPGGGALFHHDAFDEPPDFGQRAVLYLQLTGTSAWLALSIADLAERVEEFAAALAEGDAPWVKADLFPTQASYDAFARLVAARPLLEAELARPGCGSLAAVVNRGPEFTGLLADAGHAWLLDAGDALVLPNHGFGATCMHSVFCASEGPGYALSMAVRRQHPKHFDVPRGRAVSYAPRDGARRKRRSRG